MLLYYRAGSFFDYISILYSYRYKSSVRNNSDVSHANKHYSTKDYSTIHKKGNYNYRYAQFSQSVYSTIEQKHQNKSNTRDKLNDTVIKSHQTAFVF